jgi:putative peptide zinc metalloprotease protein
MYFKKLREDLEIVPREEKGKDAVYVIRDRISGKNFLFNKLQYLITQYLDGRTSPETIQNKLNLDYNIEAPLEKINNFIEKLEKIKLLESSSHSAQIRELQKEQLDPRSFKGQTEQTVRDALRYRIPLADPDKFFTALYKKCRIIFTKPFIVISALMIFAFFVILAISWNDFISQLGTTRKGWLILASYLILLVIMIPIHEIAHGLVCKHFGGEISQFGMMLLLWNLLFYVRMNDVWFIKEKYKRVWIDAAGIYANLLAGGIASIVWFFTNQGSIPNMISFYFMTIAIFLTAINLYPFLPLDGYFIMMDSLELINLRVRSFQYISLIIKGKLFRRKSIFQPKISRKERILFPIYGTLSILSYLGLMALAFYFLIAGFIPWMTRLYPG